MMVHIIVAIPFTQGHGYAGPFSSLLFTALQESALGLYPLSLPGQASILAPPIQDLG